jgi:hypothetical protein
LNTDVHITDNLKKFLINIYMCLKVKPKCYFFYLQAAITTLFFVPTIWPASKQIVILLFLGS